LYTIPNIITISHYYQFSVAIEKRNGNMFEISLNSSLWCLLLPKVLNRIMTLALVLLNIYKVQGFHYHNDTEKLFLNGIINSTSNQGVFSYYHIYTYIIQVLIVSVNVYWELFHMSMFYGESQIYVECKDSTFIFLLCVIFVTTQFSFLTLSTTLEATWHTSLTQIKLPHWQKGKIEFGFEGGKVDVHNTLRGLAIVDNARFM
jgi:hypothetical protein